VRLLPGQDIGLALKDPAGPVLVVIRTRYDTAGETGQVPRELWIEISGPGDSLEAARKHLHDSATTVVNILALANNAAIEELQTELTFDATEGLNEHEFFQNFIQDETGLPRESRKAEPDDFDALLRAMTDDSSDRARLLRASAQYELALRNWIPGHEVLAMAHLYMAMEALTKVALKREETKAGSKDQLLYQWAIDLKTLDSEIRRRALFQGDLPAYREAKAASDGLEHGYGDMAEIRGLSVRHRNAVAKYVREAIFAYAPLPDEVRNRLLDERLSFPLACTRLGKYLRATLHGRVADMVQGPLQYPMFRLTSTIESIVNNPDGGYEIVPGESVTAIWGKNVTATDVRFEYWSPTAGPDSTATTG
jgi:hypothetical protein